MVDSRRLVRAKAQDGLSQWVEGVVWAVFQDVRRSSGKTPEAMGHTLQATVVGEFYTVKAAFDISRNRTDRKEVCQDAPEQTRV